MSEYIISILTVDGLSVYSLYLKKPAGDSWGLLVGDPNNIPWLHAKIQLVINFVHPKCYLAWGNSHTDTYRYGPASEPARAYLGHAYILRLAWIYANELQYLGSI